MYISVLNFKHARMSREREREREPLVLSIFW